MAEKRSGDEETDEWKDGGGVAAFVRVGGSGLRLFGERRPARLPVDVPEPPGHQELHDAAQEHVEREGEPEGVVADHRSVSYTQLTLPTILRV